MRLKTTIILAACAVVLGAIYVLLDLLPATRLPTTEELRNAGQAVFAGSEFRSGEGANTVRLRDLITRVAIERARPGGQAREKVEFERVSPPPDTKWRIRQPIQTDAATGEVGLLCYELETLKIKSAIRATASPEGKEHPLDLAAFGLDKPQASVTFTVEKPGEPAATWTLLAGRLDAAGQALYVKRADENVIYAVGQGILTRLRKPVNELRDPVVMAVKPESVTALELRYAERPSTIRCELKDGVWRTTKPVSDFAEAGRITEVLEAAGKLRVKPEDFITEDDSALARYGLDKPRVTVTIEQKGETLSLLLGAPVEAKAKVYAKRTNRPTVFALDKRDVAAFTLDQADVRSMAALRFDPDDVTAVDLDLPTGKVALKKSADSWNIESPVKLPADPAQVKGFLSALERLTVTGWVDDEKPDLAKYNLAIPLASVTLTTKGDARASLSLGAPDESGAVYARRGGGLPRDSLDGGLPRDSLDGGLPRDSLDGGLPRDSLDGGLARHSLGDGGPLLKLKADFLDSLLPGYLAFIETRLHIADGTITALTIERPDGTYVCRLLNKVWQIESPVEAPADQDTLRTIAWNTSFLRAARFVEQKTSDLARYGLDKPAMKLTVTSQKPSGASKETITKTLLLGNESGADSVFAMIEGNDTIFTVAKDAVGPLQKPLVSRVVCEFDSAKVVSLAIQGAGKPLRFEKQGGPSDVRMSWVRKLPDEGDADAQAIESLLAAMSHLTAERVVAYSMDDAAKYGLDKPGLIVTAGLGDTSYTVTVGGKTEGGDFYVAGRGPLVYLLKAADVEKLKLPPAQ